MAIKRKRMEWLLVALLLVVAANGQDETDADGDAEAGEAAGKSEEGGEEEAWQYVEFLKADVK